MELSIATLAASELWRILKPYLDEEPETFRRAKEEAERAGRPELYHAMSLGIAKADLFYAALFARRVVSALEEQSASR